MDMHGDDPKIVRLPVRMAPSVPDDAPSIRDEVLRILAEAEDADEPLEGRPAAHLPPAPARKDPPPVHHRNTVVCPQCDRWTWLATQLCFYCDYDLFAHLQREVHAQQQRWKTERRDRLLRYALGFTVGGAAIVLGSTFFPREIGWLIGLIGVAALFLAAVFNAQAR